MNYKCPECGRPQLCGRLIRESFFFGEKLVDYEMDVTCRGCGTKWHSIARVGKNKIEYDRMDFISIDRKKTDKTWESTVRDQALKLKEK